MKRFLAYAMAIWLGWLGWVALLVWLDVIP